MAGGRDRGDGWGKGDGVVEVEVRGFAIKGQGASG